MIKNNFRHLSTDMSLSVAGALLITQGIPELSGSAYHGSTGLLATSILSGIAGGVVGRTLSKGMSLQDSYLNKSLFSTSMGVLAGIGAYSVASIAIPSIEIKELKKEAPKAIIENWQDRFQQPGRPDIVTANSWQELAAMAKEAATKSKTIGPA